MPHLWEGLPTRPRLPWGSPDLSLTSWSSTQTVLDVREGLPTRSRPPEGYPDPSRTFGRVP